MTASVGGAAPGTVDQLLQSVRGRVSSRRDDDRQTRDNESDAQDVKKDYSRPKAASSSDSTVSRSDKASARKQSKSESDGDDASFAETIDSIGQQEPPARPNVERSDNWPQNTLVPAAASVGDNLAKQQTPEIVQQPAESPQRAMRPVNLLRQDSIAALIDAKARLMPSDEIPKAAEVTMPDTLPPQQDLQSDVLDNVTDRTPAIVNGQETHWNFNDKAIAAAALQASGVQSEDRPTQRVFPPFRVTETPQKSVGPSDDTSPPVQVQAVTAPTSADTSDESFLADKDQTGPRLQQSATGDPAIRKIVKSDPSDSIERVFSVDPKPPQGAVNVTAQVRNGVVDALAGSTGELNPSTTVTDLQDRAPSPPPVLRSLDLTLSPPDLGSVRLRMSLKSNALEIEADASKAATAKILIDDRTSLERGLRDAGYDVTSLKITDVSSSNATNASGQQANGSPSRDGDQARPNFAGQQGGDSQRREGATFGQPQRRQQDQSQQTSVDLASGRAGGAVYI
ncbi:flagellar hook-length control protein FliK [Hyphomicrobium sp.]|uniref:flagellar hook-length control protein FliK n=1 Tax=Hyphomicrobium sp. TaxID=82 RepID=UPI000F95F93A|nr:flagellar hook-length control protein FliK [Hyphomicrobium sp.]RUP07474.1 MAG: flagellar hook-length control protein FliK [Hyphomicrobium sp.]